VDRKKDYLFFGVLGIILAIHWSAYFQAIQISSVAIGVTSIAFVPIITAFLEPAFFREKLLKKNIVTALVAFVGIFLIVPEFSFSNNIVQGLFWAFVTGGTFSVLSILHRKYVRRYSGVKMLAYETSVATMILIIPTQAVVSNITPTEILLLIVLAVVFTGLPHALFINSLKYLKVSSASVINTAVPILAVLLAFLLLGEIPTTRTIAGGLLVLAASFYTSKQYLK
jgi:drug/metabolite transporter (DMT)-like permease